ncbi:MAG: hypothetical protein P4L46_11675 [Fimbriimonas sp.]|nr:hypothetical protein [Fimbriimonas sp.]
MIPIRCIDLSGTWEIALDANGVGVAERWYAERLPGCVRLPGSLDENGIGEPNLDPRDLSGLSRKVRYTGAAWYSRVVDIPEDWPGTELTLYLERVHWFSDLWVDGVPVGSCDSLSVPHRYRFTPETDARQVRITLRIDNTPRIPVGRIGHALTDWTQTNWNGVVGEISLTRFDQSLEDVKVVSGSDHIRVEGLTGISGTLAASVGTARAEFTVVAGEPFSFRIESGCGPWSDQSPERLEVGVELNGQSRVFFAAHRSIARSGKQILLNDEPLFLRGTLECCVFPRTGYPPMTQDPWKELMLKAKSFGLNHLRLHSWCPPEAAFAAADEVGMILQVELPVWTGLWPISSDVDLMDFCRRESHRILQEYSQHPSFALFALGNEIAFYGPEPEVDDLLCELRAAFPNRLYTFSSQGTHLSPVCDYFVQADNGKPGPENRPLRGSTWFGVGSRFDRESPNTLVTCNEAADQFDRPVISHEVAEWAVFPDVHRACAYDGVLVARNFHMIADMLRERGMEDQAPAFVDASGRLSALLYKEEIETLLRTRGLVGYQLLGLTDFPGQGTATVGMLDVFWRDKGFIDAESFRQFCAPTVPLLAYSKTTWLSDETYRAEASVFQCGPRTSAELCWQVSDSVGTVLRSGSLGAKDLLSGEATPFGTVEFRLGDLPTPARYEIQLTCSQGAVNRWSLWVYPESLPTVDLPDILVAPFYRNDVRVALREGRTVWLRINPSRTWSGIPGRFAPAFWSPIHFKEQVGTMGTLIDDRHPVFGGFPTAHHTDWQWWDVLTKSKAIVLDDLPAEFRPELQIIDRYERNHKLGTIFEAAVGPGRLVVSMIDFDDLTDRPAARQLEYSIRMYLSASAKPKQTLTIAELDKVFVREP